MWRQENCRDARGGEPADQSPPCLAGTDPWNNLSSPDHLAPYKLRHVVQFGDQQQVQREPGTTRTVGFSPGRTSRYAMWLMLNTVIMSPQ